jgi:superoxide dismutase, Cu-Zn family
MIKLIVKKFILIALFIAGSLGVVVSHAGEITTRVVATGAQKALGIITFRDTHKGLLIIVNLTDLPPGKHGFHLHQNPNCSNHGVAAGGHFDPKKTNSHQGPYGKGHLGDLPVLYVKKNGRAQIQMIAPRLKTAYIKGLTVMIHAGGDNYTDNPKLGGGGARIGCGIIPSKID